VCVCACVCVYLSLRERERVRVQMCACVRTCVCVQAFDYTMYVHNACTYDIVVKMDVNVCPCVCTCEHLITIFVIHRKLVINGVLVYIHDAHIRLGIGFAGTCVLQCLLQCVLQCVLQCCSVCVLGQRISRLYPRRAYSPWHQLC